MHVLQMLKESGMEVFFGMKQAQDAVSRKSGTQHLGLASWACILGLHLGLASWACILGLHLGLASWACFSHGRNFGGIPGLLMVGSRTRQGGGRSRPVDHTLVASST